MTDTRPLRPSDGEFRDDCEFSSPTGCRRCGAPPTPPKLYYCSDDCMQVYLANHSWSVAREVAMHERIEIRGGYIYGYDQKPCALADGDCSGAIEVDHVVPLNGHRPTIGCVHHQEGLRPLCHHHHVEETKRQRRSGLIGTAEDAARLCEKDRLREERAREMARRRAEWLAANPRLL